MLRVSRGSRFKDRHTPLLQPPFLALHGHAQSGYNDKATGRPFMRIDDVVVVVCRTGDPVFAVQ